MNQNQLLKIFPISILVMLLFNSCIKDSINELGNMQGVEISPNLSVPIVNGHFGIADIYNGYSAKAYIVEGSDKFVTFIYKSNVDLTPKQFIKIPSVGVNLALKMDQGAIAQFNFIGSFQNSFSNYAVINVTNKERLKKVSVKTGSFTINVSSDFKHDAYVVFSYPSIARNGIPLIDTFKVLYAGVSPIVVNKVLDISGYDVDLSDRGISYNVIPYLVDIDIRRNPANGISVNDQLRISENLAVNEYNYIQGYLGKFVLLSDTTNDKLDIFDKNTDGNAFIKDPKVRIAIHNGIGLPITAKVSSMTVTTGKNLTYPVNIDQFKDTFTIAYPTINQLGQIAQCEYLIDRTNSNIDSVFSHAPQGVFYKVNFTANYNENVDEDNFLLANNTFATSATVEFPLEIKLVSYQLRFKTGINWPPTDNVISFDVAKITGQYQNSFPIGTTFQAYFAKDSTILGLDSIVVIDSLYDKPTNMPGAIVDATGKILKPSVFTNEIIMSKSKFDFLTKTATKLVFVAYVKTSDYNTALPYVKIYSDQGMDFKIGIEIKGKFRQSFNSQKP